ncbi:MAG TPA: hypothetical protein VFV58_12400 [Blastocatellia bacterium]|jgi:hypothetical protein|nr:hypothetical protein [Blastocatellia bacterium]
MSKFFAAVLFGALVFGGASCSKIKTITGDYQNLKKVGDLWSDVPRMDGLGPSEAEMPIYVKLLMRTALNNLGRLNNENEDRTHSTGDWVVFTTAKLPEDVKNFYTNDRMTSFGGWDASKNSTCLNGSEYSFSGVGCVFGKNSNNRAIGLLIVAAQDEQKKQTTVFFVRVETDETPVANNQAVTAISPKAAKGQIKTLNGTAPYGIEKRPMPAGLNLDELLPKQVGPYTRALIEKSNQRGAPPSSIEIDGNSVYATYAAGDKEIFVEFAVTSSPENAQTALDVAATEVTGKFPSDQRFGSIGTEPSYLNVNNQSGAFCAWTRGGYYFSANAKGGKADLDLFMRSFPY